MSLQFPEEETMSAKSTCDVVNSLVDLPSDTDNGGSNFVTHGTPYSLKMKRAVRRGRPLGQRYQRRCDLLAPPSKRYAVGSTANDTATPVNTTTFRGGDGTCASTDATQFLRGPGTKRKRPKGIRTPRQPTLLSILDEIADSIQERSNTCSETPDQFSDSQNISIEADVIHH